jgi:peptidyl-prolyl cis-trans isomerase C
MTRLFRIPAFSTLGLLAVLTLPGCAKAQPDAEATAAAKSAQPPAADAVAPPAPAPTSDPEQARAAAVPPATDADAVLPDEQIPAVVARLDGREISRDDLLAHAAEARGALAARGVPQPRPTRGFYRQVLDDLIGNSLLYRELDQQGKAATAAQVDEQIAAIRAQFKSEEEFDQMLVQRGFDRDRLRREVAQSLTVNRWVSESVVPGIQVTEDEARRFFTDNSAQMVEPERVKVRHVLIAVAPEATPEQKTAARTEAEQVRARIAGGADFATVAKESSDDAGSKEQGGELGWLARGRSVPAFERAAFELEPGKLSQPVETRFGFHVLEVEEKRAPSALAFDQVRPRLEEMLKQRKLEQAVRGKLNELGTKAKIEILI